MQVSMNLRPKIRVLWFFLLLTGSQSLFSRHLIVFSIDSCRADRFGIYGYPRATSPNIDSWARTGTVFRNAYSTSAWTAPGLVSLLSGLYPPTHEVNNRDRMGSPDLITLPKLLRQRGYEVPNLNVFTFAPYYVNLGLGPVERRYFGKEPGDELLNWLTQNLDSDRTEPFFVFYHSTIVHQPYNPSDDVLPAPREELEKRPAIRAVLNGAIVPLGSVKFAEGDKKILDQLYDAEIRKVDALFGAMLDILKEKGLLDETLIVLAADHGEELLDHGFVGHASTSLQAKLYEELTRIPLIFSWPGHVPVGRIADGLASQIDVLPTVLSLLGWEPPEPVEGINLLAPEAAQRTLYFESIIAGNQTTRENEKLWVRAARKGHFKFITTEELYDLQADPLEKTNLAEVNSELARTMRKDIDAWVDASHQKAREIFQAQPRLYVPRGKATRCPTIQVPADESVLSYDQHTGAVLLQWRGDLRTEYLVQYDIGTGDHHITGIFPVEGNHQLLGPLNSELWGNLKAWNPFKIRVSPRASRTCWSEWVSFEF